jgi:CRP-like cAMP-binding protein
MCSRQSRGGMLGVSSSSEINPLIRKLESIVTLSEEERSALLRLPLHVTHLRAEQDIVREGDQPSRCCAPLGGFTCSYKVSREGGRQIVAFAIPGDIPDLQSLHLKTLDNSLATVTPCKVGFIEHESLRYVCERHPRIASALWRETLVDAAIHRERMTSMGRRDAASRIAHLLCELLVRMRVVGLADEDSCDLPLTQQALADALGLTDVHVNRTLRELREAGLVALKARVLTVENWEKLKDLGEFDPTYLHLVDRDAAD